MRILITGSQTWPTEDRHLIEDAIAEHIDATTDRAVTIIHGTHPSGVDPIVAAWVAEITPYAARRGVLIDVETWGPYSFSAAVEDGADLCLVVASPRSRLPVEQGRTAARAGIPVQQIRATRARRKAA